MRLIKTQQDLTTLRSARLFPSLLPHIQIYFNQLRDEIGDTGDRLFVLDRYGYIVILEVGDNLYDLECVGLNRKDCGLLGSMPEYVETLQLGDITVYKIVVMYTNDFIITFFTQKGIHAEEIEQWLNEQANIS